MIRKIHLITLALVAAAIAAPIAQATADANAKPDPCRNVSAQCIYGVPRPSESFARASTPVASLKPDPCRNVSAQCIYGVLRPSESFARTSTSRAIEAGGRGGFSWGDAVLGAAVTAGVFLLGATGALLRQRRRALANP